MEGLAKKTILTLYKAYVTTYTFVAGLHKEQYLTAQIIHHKEMMCSRASHKFFKSIKSKTDSSSELSSLSSPKQSKMDIMECSVFGRGKP
jgi:hypothetical protein